MRTLVITALSLLLGSLAHAQDTLGETGIKGAGSTFAHPVLARWSHDYRSWLGEGGDFPAPNSGLDDPLPSSALEYEAIGSLAGTLRLKERAVDFAASDAPLSADELTKLGLAQFPIVIGGVVVAYNLAGVGPGALRLNGSLLANIYLGKIQRWSDPAIAALNPGLKLPDAAIRVMHRADGSGTTFNFSEYLSRVSRQWKLSAGSGLLIHWPTGEGAKGNEGLAKAVKATPNAIGYVEFAQANKSQLAFAQLQNSAGRFIQPSPASFQAASTSVDWSRSKDFDVLLIDAPGAEAYPLSATVFGLMQKRAERTRNGAVLDFFRWSLKHGAKAAAQLGYVPLPSALVQRVSDYWLATFGAELASR